MTSTETRSQVDRAVALARAEQTSGEIYGKDWWDFTRYLGNLTGNAKEIGEVYAAVAPILSADPEKPISRQYLSNRRALARKIHSEVYRTRMYYKLPPRVSLEWSAVSGKDAVLDTATARKLIEFEASGKSLRDIYEILEGREKPRSWQSAAERAESDAGIRQAALREALTPEVVREAIRDIPAVRRAVVADPATRVALNREHDDFARESTKDVPLVSVDADDKRNRFLQTADIAVKIDRMGTLADEVRRLLKDHAVDQETRSTYAGQLVVVMEKISAMVTGLRSDAEFESMMAREGLA